MNTLTFPVWAANFNNSRMKRTRLLTLLLACSIALNLGAQTEQDEKLRRLTADMEALIASNAELQRRIARLTEELAKVRDEQSRAANDSSVQALREDVRKLAKQDILDLLGIELGPVRLKCALLSLKVLKGGVYGLEEVESLDEMAAS